MLAKTDEQNAEAVEKELGIGIQIAATIGAQRSLTLTAGVPLSWTCDQINETLDKLAEACDRQKRRHDLEQTKMLLKNEEQNVHQFRQQVVAQEAHFRDAFFVSNRQGEWRPNASQRQQLENLQKNVDNSSERIGKLREQIKELERECR